MDKILISEMYCDLSYFTDYSFRTSFWMELTKAQRYGLKMPNKFGLREFLRWQNNIIGLSEMALCYRIKAIMYKRRLERCKKKHLEWFYGSSVDRVAAFEEMYRTISDYVHNHMSEDQIEYFQRVMSSIKNGGKQNDRNRQSSNDRTTMSEISGAG